MDKGGKPAFDRVMRGLRLLQRRGVEHHVLTTVNAINADHPLAVYRFLRDEVGTTWMQFIPAWNGSTTTAWRLHSAARRCPSGPWAPSSSAAS